MFCNANVKESLQIMFLLIELLNYCVYTCSTCSFEAKLLSKVVGPIYTLPFHILINSWNLIFNFGYLGGYKSILGILIFVSLIANEVSICLLASLTLLSSYSCENLDELL